MERLHPAMLKQMRECGIAVEVQDTVSKRSVRRQRPSEGGVVTLGAPPVRPKTLAVWGWARGRGVLCPMGRAVSPARGLGLHSLPLLFHSQTHVQPSTS